MNNARFAPWLACVLVMPATQAATNGWSAANGPPGAYVTDIVYLDGTNGVALATTTQGIYRTTNHGAQWTLSQRFGPSTATRIAVNPANRSQVVVAIPTASVSLVPPLMRSIDGGTTFEAAGNAFDLNGLWSVTFSADGTLWSSYYGGHLRKSTDLGRNWTTVAGPSSGVPNPIELAADPSNGNLVYAFGWNGDFRTESSGASWIPLTNTIAFLQFEVSRTQSGLLFARSQPQGISYRSFDFGASWTQMGTTPMSSMTSAPSTPGRVLAFGDDYHALVSSDNGANWSDLGRLPNAHAWRTSIGMDPARILLATGSGVIGSSDGGANWEERVTGMNELTAFRLLPPVAGATSLHVLASDLQSIYRLDASGAWAGVARASTPSIGYPLAAGNDYHVAISPANASVMYMVRAGHVGRSSDGGATWTRQGAMPTFGGMIHGLTVHSVDPQILYAATDRHLNPGSVLRSTDGGVSWTAHDSGLPDSIKSVIVVPQQPQTLYAITTGAVNHYAPVPVYRSTDSGATWTPGGAPSPMSIQARTLAIDPTAPGTLYLGLHNSAQKSTDGGVTWTELDTFNNPGAKQFLFDPQLPNIIYVLSDAGDRLWRSVDSGLTWEPLGMNDQSGVSAPALSIALVPGHNARLVSAKSHGTGLLEYDVSPWIDLKATTNQMTAGSSTQIGFTITNAWVLTPTSLRLRATLPAASSPYEASGTGATCNVTGRELTCDVARLPPNFFALVAVRFTPAAAGSWTAELVAHEPLHNIFRQTIDVAAAPPPPSSSSGGGNSSSGGSGGGGGGGSLDYLLLALLGALAARRLRTH